MMWRRIWVRQNGDPRQLWAGFLEETYSLSRYLRARLRETRHVSAWMSKAHDKLARHRVGRASENNWNCRSRLPSTGRLEISPREDHIDAKMNELCRQSGQPVVALLRPPVLDNHILAFNVTGFAKPFAECLDQIGTVKRRTGTQPTYARQRSARPLRLGGERRGDGTSQRGQQEAASIHAGMVGQARIRSQRRVPSQRGERMSRCGH